MSPDHPNVVSLNLRRRAPKPVAESQPADRRQRISTFLKTALQGDLFKGDEAGAQPYIEALKAAAALEGAGDHSIAAIEREATAQGATAKGALTTGSAPPGRLTGGAFPNDKSKDV
jgi:hypothetical protein